MVLESTIICVDNSEYMRNGDFLPSRLQAQQDAVSLICHSKLRSNPENNVGLLTLANTEVLATLTTDVGKILSKLHQLQPKGDINVCTGIRIAHLALKHRQGKHHKMRIVMFVGSPIIEDEKEIVKLAKKFKKEKVCVDIVNFGEDAHNTEKLTLFINTLNGKEGGGSHLVTVPPGPHLSDALVSSPVVQGEDGSGAGLSTMGFEFGVDPNEDPELALALRVSMEEQRQRQEEEARRTVTASAAESGTPQTVEGSSDEALLEQAVAMSLATDNLTSNLAPERSGMIPDLASMTEEEQIAYAMQMSLQQTHDDSEPMETDHFKEEDDYYEELMEDSAPKQGGQDTENVEEEDYQEVMEDPAFIQSVLQDLPGVNPESAEVRNAVGSLASEKEKKTPKKKEEGDKDKDKSS